MNLIQSGFLEREIRAVLPIGGSKINRLQKVLYGINILHTHRPPHNLAHALHDNNLDIIKVDVEFWEVKDGFPCAHKRPKQYLLDLKLTFTKLYQRYKDKIESTNDSHRVISYSHWIQYIHLFFLAFAQFAPSRMYVITTFISISSYSETTFLLMNVIACFWRSRFIWMSPSASIV